MLSAPIHGRHAVAAKPFPFAVLCRSGQLVDTHADLSSPSGDQLYPTLRNDAEPKQLFLRSDA
jgi:hypothetical protein